MIARSIAGTRKRATLELGGKAANIVFDDAPIDQAIEGIVNGIFFNQGQVCCAGSQTAGPGVDRTTTVVKRRLKRRLATLRRRPPGQEHRRRRDQLRRQLDRITELSAAGEAEGALRWDSGCPLPDTGFWFRPTVFTGRRAGHRIAQEEIFGPVLSVLTFRTPGEAVAKANNTPYGLSAGVWTEKGSRILWMADQLRAGVVWANTFNQFDPTSPFGGFKESGYGREGGRHGLAAYVTTGGVRMSRGRGPQDLQALCRRRLPPQRVRPVVCRPRRRPGAQQPGPAFLANAAARPPARTPATRSSLPARRQPGWAGATAYNRGQVLYRVAEVMQGRAPIRRRGRAAEGLTRARGGSLVDAAIDRWVWYAGWSDKLAQVLGGLNPVAGPFFDISAPGAHRGRGHPCATGKFAARAGQRRGPGHRVGQHRVVVASQERPVPAVTLAESSPPPTSPGGSSISSPATPPKWRPGWPRTATSTRSTSPGSRTPTGVVWGDLEAAAAENLKRVLRPAGNGSPRRQEPDWSATPDLSRMTAFLETKTVWHPKGR
jgi:acyl-CoA reductase-like NAD-dependent aldehyde dehydrogenase